MNRRSFLVSVAGAAAAARAFAAERKGFPGTLCFFSKHLPDHREVSFSTPGDAIF